MEGRAGVALQGRRAEGFLPCPGEEGRQRETAGARRFFLLKKGTGFRPEKAIV